MSFTQFSKIILEECADLLNWAWKPIEADEDISVKSTGCKFGGVDPFRSKNFLWPKCSECGFQKAFICQIDIKNLPEKLQQHIQRKTGLFQCFFCLDCMPCDYCFEDIFFVPEEELFPSLQSLASKFIFKNDISTDALPNKLKLYVQKYNEVFQRSDISRRQCRQCAVVDNCTMRRYHDWEGFEEINIKEWVELKREIPGYEELSGNGNGGLEHIILTKTGISEDDLGDLFNMGHEELLLGPEGASAPIQFPDMPASGMKLGGYVRWVQNAYYPECPDCDVPMTITFLQMEDNISPYEWLDCGTAHVTLCPQCGRPGFGMTSF